MLKIRSWNVWFAEFELISRMENIMAELGNGIDVICLQEVTYDVLTALKNTPQSKYYNFFYDTSQIAIFYGQIFLVHKKIDPTKIIFHSVPFTNTKMGRKMSILRINNIQIINVHLESEFKRGGFTPTTKYNQLTELFAFGNNGVGFETILVGDFNFNDDDTNHFEECCKSYGYFWLNPKQTSYNSAENTNIVGWYRSKLDRIVVNTPLEFSLVELMGTKPKNSLFPSDHFGIGIDKID